MPKMKTTITMEPGILAELDWLAGKDQRSRSNELEWLVHQEYESRLVTGPQGQGSGAGASKGGAGGELVYGEIEEPA